MRFIILFSITLSGSSIVGLSGTLQFPSLHLSHGYLQGADENWTPAGPAMDILFETSFTDVSSEFRDMQSRNPSIDFADGYLLSSLVDPFVQSPNFGVTLPQYLGINEVEFNLANNFWGCDFHFGLSPCGVDIRQGIAHLIDKTIFASKEADIMGSAAVIDNPLSPGAAVPTPVSCNWDANFPETGSQCMVGGTQPGQTSYTGGTAYHLARASGVCVPSSLGGCNTFVWMQSNPSPDFCAAAYDIVTGVNLGIPALPPPGAGWMLSNPPGGTFPNGDPSSWTFKSQTDCHLVPFGSLDTDAGVVSSGPVTFDIRTENPALALLGENYAEEICAIWTGSFTLGCMGIPIGGHTLTTYDALKVSLQNQVAFPGYSTSTSSGPTKSWGMFTAGAAGYSPLNPFEGHPELLLGEPVKRYCNNVGCDPFDMNLYFTFNSRFVSGISSIQQANGGSCSNSSVPTPAAADYMYLCDPNYDRVSNQMEFANCLAAEIGSDPSASQAIPTFGNCLSSNGGGLSAVSAAYKAEDAVGKNAYTIPVYTKSVQYAFHNNAWSHVINAGGTNNYFNLPKCVESDFNNPEYSEPGAQHFSSQS